MNFLERFKGKISKIGKHGNINFDCNKPVPVIGHADQSTKIIFHPDNSPTALPDSQFIQSNYPLSFIDSTLSDKSERKEDKTPTIRNTRGIPASRKQQHMSCSSSDPINSKPIPPAGTVSIWNKETPIEIRPYRKTTRTVDDEYNVNESISPVFAKRSYPLITEAKKPPILSQLVKDPNFHKLNEKKLKLLTGSELTYAVPNISRTNKSVPGISSTKQPKESKVLKNAAYHYLSSSKPWSNPNTYRDEERQNTSQSSNVSILSAPSSIKYRPYGIKDYREIKPKNYYTLGGLGPNLGGKEWQKRNERARRMQKYAKTIKEYNKDLKQTTTHSKPLPEHETALQMRQKMLEYAKHVPKPKLSQIMEVDEGSTDTRKESRTDVTNPFLHDFNYAPNLIYS